MSPGLRFDWSNLEQVSNSVVQISTHVLMTAAPGVTRLGCRWRCRSAYELLIPGWGGAGLISIQGGREEGVQHNRSAC